MAHIIALSLNSASTSRLADYFMPITVMPTNSIGQVHKRVYSIAYFYIHISIDVHEKTRFTIQKISRRQYFTAR